MLTHVMKYVEKGFKVFPVKSRDKIPLTKHGHLDASSEKAQIETWWAEYPEANIGLVVGEEAGFSVLDVDPRNGGEASFNHLIEKYGALPETVTASTGGGGKHFFFKYHPNFKIPSDCKQGLDVKNTGYVVVPPSVHFSGKLYQWEEQKSLAEHVLAELPHFLINENSSYQVTGLKTVTEGERHNTLVKLVGSWFGRKLSFEECSALALDANDKFNPPLETSEVASVVASLHKKEADKKTQGFGFTSIGSLKNKRLKWLIKDILPSGVLCFISAIAKHGKTTLAMHIALCLTAGGLFLGRYPLGRRKPYKVLYIPLEDHLGEFKSKVKNLIGDRRFPKNLKLLNTPVLSLPKDIEDLKIDIQKGGFDLVILDTLRRAHESEEDSSSKMAPIVNGLRALVNTQKITVIVIHHAGHKVEDSENPSNYLRGTSDFNGAWETLIALQKQKESIVLRAFHRYRSLAKVAYKIVRGSSIDKQTGDYPIVDLVFVPPDDPLNKQDELGISKELRNAPLSGNRLQSLTGLPRLRVDEALNRLYEQKKVEQKGHGKNLKWHLIG